jgi:hypothetical protein
MTIVDDRRRPLMMGNLRPMFAEPVLSSSASDTCPPIQIRFEPQRRVWFMMGLRYGGGLPVELDDEDDDEEEEEGEEEEEEDDDHAQPIPQAILDKVNFERGRVRPNLSLDVSVGFRVWERDSRSMTLRFDVRNATDRLNVINFSGLFSGTALAPGRQITAQMKLRF